VRARVLRLKGGLFQSLWDERYNYTVYTAEGNGTTKRKMIRFM